MFILPFRIEDRFGQSEEVSKFLLAAVEQTDDVELVLNLIPSMDDALQNLRQTASTGEAYAVCEKGRQSSKLQHRQCQ